MLSSRRKSLENSKIYIYHWCQKSQKNRLNCVWNVKTWNRLELNDKYDIEMTKFERGGSLFVLSRSAEKMQFCTLSKGNFSQQLMKVPRLVFVIGESVISWSMNCPNPGSKFVNFVENFLCAFDIFLEIILGFGSSLPWWSRLRLSRS